ncbi:MAG: PAS domain S-box protein, partial [Calditrichaeota bacterium]
RKSGGYIWVQISGVPITDAGGNVVGSFGIITDITERKQAEAALRRAQEELERRVGERTEALLQANEKLQQEINERIQAEEERQKFISLVENSNDVILMASLEGQLLYLNRAGRKLFGWFTEADVQARRLVECHPERVREYVETTVLPTLAQKGVWEGELPLWNRRTEAEIPALLNGFLIRHPHTNEVLALALICRDITERKRAEEALRRAKDELELRVQERTAELSQANRVLRQEILDRERAEAQLQESEEKYRLLFNSAHDAIFVYHPEGEGPFSRFVEVNDVACQKLGYSREELLNLSPAGISLRHHQEDLQEQLKRLLQEKHLLYEDVLLTREGREIPVEISAHLFHFKGQPMVMAIARDIAARKRAEERIREQAALLDKARDAIMVCDLTDHLIYWNKSAERLYGWKVEEAIGNNMFSLLFKGDAEAFLTARRAVLQKGEWQGELRQVTKAGREIIVESRCTLVHDDEGEARSILIVNTDITERKMIEAQFLRAQRMESIGSLAGGIAHDLNNVLAPILTAVQILQVRLTDEKSRRILQTIESNVTRGAEMVRQILTFARGVEGERVALQIDRLIGDLERMLRETFPRTIEIHSHFGENLWTVSGDATQLHQVLLNLCVNARDAMPRGGRLTLMAENVYLDEQFARTHLDAQVGPYVLISVHDTGVGIPSDIIDKIFEPFFTTKTPDKGTGLGLSTVLAIVKSHGGFVNVSSQVGVGTVFEVYLPASSADTVPEVSLPDVDLLSGQGETILIIDDEPAILEITRETLETYGYHVLVARNGKEALTLFAHHKQAVKAVITDMIMPVMDGASTIKALREINPEVKIIAASGYMEDSRVSELIGDGANAFLQKPYTAERVLTLLHQLLRGT